MNVLSVAVDSWIIQDGNYGDFAIGDKAKFALEFSGDTLRPTASKRATARHLGRAVYEVCAQAVFVSADAWAIDFGFSAFSESPPAEFVAPGTWVEGELLVGIDPFFYMEYFHKLPGMPSLFYNWHIASIIRNDTPWLVEVSAHGGKTLTRDEKNEAWTDVASTDAWTDDEGRSSYVLTVERSDT
jgi:hypothetical protein